MREVKGFSSEAVLAFQFPTKLFRQFRPLGSFATVVVAVANQEVEQVGLDVVLAMLNDAVLQPLGLN